MSAFDPKWTFEGEKAVVTHFGGRSFVCATDGCCRSFVTDPVLSEVGSWALTSAALTILSTGEQVGAALMRHRRSPAPSSRPTIRDSTARPFCISQDLENSNPA